MVVSRYALSCFNFMPQQYIHAVYCYKTSQYQPYTKYKYTLFINKLPYTTSPKHVITPTVKCPNMENETACKFRSNITDICILKNMGIFFHDNENNSKNFLVGQYLLKPTS
jgi:hypothetical protein